MELTSRERGYILRSRAAVEITLPRRTAGVTASHAKFVVVFFGAAHGTAR